MKPFIMYKLEPFEGITLNGAGVGGRVTTKVRFVGNKFDMLDPIAGATDTYDGSFTGILRGVVISDDNTRGRMFFDDDVEIIYDIDNMPELSE